MTTPPPVAEITGLLAAWRQGDRSVEDALAAAIYPVLRELSRAQVRRHSGRLTLAATELANEAYERLHRQRAVDWQNRDHFFAIASTVIRRVIVDYLRQRGSEKRGGDAVMVELDHVEAGELTNPDDGIDWLALDQALTELGAVDAECARVVEMRLFSGLTVEQIADVNGSSTATVGRQWRFARVWLSERLGSGAASDG